MTHIAVSGIIGVGKTTFAKELGDALHLPVFYEKVFDAEHLADFYGDMKSNAFCLQIDLLNKRFCQHQQLSWSTCGGVQDRSIYEDTIFAKMLRDQGLIREKDYDIYMDLFRNMSKLMSVPNLIVHLDVTPEESLRRIQRRGREYEKGITLEYLTSLHKYYEDAMEEVSKTVTVVRVGWDNPTDGVKIVRDALREVGTH